MINFNNISDRNPSKVVQVRRLTCHLFYCFEVNFRGLTCFILALFLLSSCNSKTNTDPSADQSQGTQVLSLQHEHYEGELIDQAVFKRIKGDSLQKLLIQQFCEESKGYQKDVWMGLNKCSWAIEKYRIDQNPDIIQRNGDELSIILPDGSKKSFIHQDQEGRSPIYFQFKRYFPQQKYIVLEKMIEDGCIEHLFVQLQDGQETTLQGIPYFSSTGNEFVLNGKSESCLSTMELWHIKDGKLNKQWGTSLGSEKIEEINWINQHTVAIHLSSGQDDHDSHRYLSLKLH